MNESEFRTKFYEEAKKQTLGTLPDFLDKLFLESFDYGSICCAITASALAAAWAANHHPKAGITDFQAGAVMWEFIQQWNYKGNKTGLKIVDYDNMLYSQYESTFQKTISKDTFVALQKAAERLLREDKYRLDEYQKDLIRYNKDIAVFIQKYPDYKQNPKKYERLSMGTGDEWDEQRKKEKAGFEFAPAKPCYFRGQIEHWQSIVNGIIPFGYALED